MEEADRQLLYYLDLNSRASAGKLASLMGSKPEKVESRLQRLFERGIIRRCYPEINRSKLGYQPYKIYLQFQNITPEKLDEIYAYIAAQPNAGWVVACSGRWDMIIAVWAKDVEEFSETYESLLSRYHMNILAKVVSITVEFFNYNKKWLWGKGQEMESVRVGGVPECIIDATDLRILRYLGWNGRAAVPDISSQLELEPADVELRMKEMRRKGVILSFRTDLDLEAMGRTFCKSFVYLKRCSREDEERLLEYCRRHPDITSAVRLVGSWELEIEAHSVSFEAFRETMEDMRNRYPEVVRNFEAVAISRETGIMFAPHGGADAKKEKAEGQAGKA